MDGTGSGVFFGQQLSGLLGQQVPDIVCQELEGKFLCLNRQMSVEILPQVLFYQLFGQQYSCCLTKVQFPQV